MNSLLTGTMVILAVVAGCLLGVMIHDALSNPLLHLLVLRS